MLKNLSFCYFSSFLIALLTGFSIDVIIFMIYSICMFEVINAAILESRKFLWILASVAEAAAVYPNGIRTNLASGLSKVFINNKQTKEFYQEILVIVLPGQLKFLVIFISWWIFREDLQSFEICLSVIVYPENKSHHQWLGSPIIFDENFRLLSFFPFNKFALSKKYRWNEYHNNLKYQ